MTYTYYNIYFYRLNWLILRSSELSRFVQSWVQSLRVQTFCDVKMISSIMFISRWHSVAKCALLFVICYAWHRRFLFCPDENSASQSCTTDSQSIDNYYWSLISFMSRVSGFTCLQYNILLRLRFVIIKLLRDE